MFQKPDLALETSTHVSVPLVPGDRNLEGVANNTKTLLPVDEPYKEWLKFLASNFITEVEITSEKILKYAANVIMSEHGGITAKRAGHPNIF